MQLFEMEMHATLGKFEDCKHNMMRSLDQEINQINTNSKEMRHKLEKELQNRIVKLHFKDETISTKLSVVQKIENSGLMELFKK